MINQRVEQITRITRDIEPSLSKAVASHPGYGIGGVENALISTSCGFTTGILQKHLAEAHHIPTERLIAERLDTLPRDPVFSRYLNHVLLHEPESGTIIDPTYSQFVRLFGASYIEVAQKADLIDAFPNEKIAVFPSREYQQFASEFTRFCIGKRAFIADQLGADTARQQDFFTGLDDTEVPQIVASIWNLDNYEKFPLSQEDQDSTLFRGAMDILTNEK